MERHIIGRLGSAGGGGEKIRNLPPLIEIDLSNLLKKSSKGNDAVLQKGKKANFLEVRCVNATHLMLN